MKVEDRSIWEKLELGLGSGSKFRIITHLVLNHNEAFTKYALVKSTGLKTQVVKGQLKALLELGWIKKYPFTPATYQASMENEVIKHIHDFLLNMKCVKNGQILCRRHNRSLGAKN